MIYLPMPARRVVDFPAAGSSITPCSSAARTALCASTTVNGRHAMTRCENRAVPRSDHILYGRLQTGFRGREGTRRTTQIDPSAHLRADHLRDASQCESANRETGLQSNSVGQSGWWSISTIRCTCVSLTRPVESGGRLDNEKNSAPMVSRPGLGSPETTTQ